MDQGRRKHVLFADDNRAMLETVRGLLDPERYEFEGVDSGIEALCRLGERRPDLLLIDRHCPELNGFQLCALLRERQQYRGIPVVLLSDRQDVFERVRAEALGARGVLVKPFSRAELLALLEGDRADAA